MGNINVAPHIDINGIGCKVTNVSDHDIYLEAVNNARLLVHTLEAAILSLYDDSSTFLLMVQFMYLSQSHQEEDAACNYFDAIVICMKVNLDVVQQSFRALLAVGHDQAALSLWQGHPCVWRQLLIVVNYNMVYKKQSNKILYIQTGVHERRWKAQRHRVACSSDKAVC
jgi:hypothetical protein